MFNRRLRAALTIALLWGIVWAAVGMPLNLLLVYLTGPTQLGSLIASAPLMALFYGAFGAFCGLSYAAVTMFAERKRTVEEISVARLALWGGIGGALLPFLGVVIVALSGGVVLGIQINVLALLGVIAISGGFGASFAGIQARAARQLPSGATRPLSKGEIG